MEEDQEVKVVDRRSQQPSTEQQASVHVESSPSQAGHRGPEKGKAKTEALESSEDSPPMDFASFTVGLATQAMMLLGEIPEPQSGRILPTNLTGARQTIDIISMLQEKTVGNLTSDETKLIQDVLTSLRLEFVKKAKK